MYEYVKEVAPCPFCGHEGELDGAMNEEWVYCIQCQTNGPVATTVIEAIELWNRRVPEPASVPEEPSDLGASGLRDALRKIIADAPEAEPEYGDWGGDTERAETWGSEHEEWRIAQLIRRALEAEPREVSDE